MKPLTIALAKGRLLDPSARLLASLGFDLNGAANSRQLIWDDVARGARFLIAKPSDVPIYVENGAADAGIVGQDVLREGDADVYEPLALNYGHCRLVVAGKAEHAAADWRFNAGLRVATKYPRAAQKFFSARGLAAEIIGLAGSVELAPMVGLADLIVDLVDTGQTLKANGLIELAEIFKSQAAFIVNRASFTLRADELRAMMEKIEERRDQ
ncbi:MAG: ATP phosphoribosyltransferase [Chloroflexi bacterium]|nr:ATP phosphoribosyltransferase [Chloroflexota bacterium]